MKRCVALLIVLVLICALFPASAEPLPTTTPLSGYMLLPVTDEIKVFATRSLKGNLTGVITPDTQSDVQVLSVTGEWCYISFENAAGTGYGYIPLSHFSLTPKPTPTPAPAPTYPAGTSAWVQNASVGYRLNLRQDPRGLARSDGKYYTGTPVTMTGQFENGFAQVLLAGTTLGWMDLRYLTADPASFVPETPMVIVKGSSASLRSGPGTDYTRLARLDRGTQIIVLGVRSDGWYHVQVGDLVGYISDSLLSGSFPFGFGMDSDNPSLISEASDQQSVFYINTRSTDTPLHLRGSASATSKSLGVFYTGTPLTVLSYTRTGWAYVRIGQTEGYVASDYFTNIKPQQYGTLRIIHNTRATGLNLREAPSTGSALLTFAPNNSEVILLGELHNGWCYVEWNHISGYMLNNNSLEPFN